MGTHGNGDVGGLSGVVHACLLAMHGPIAGRDLERRGRNVPSASIVSWSAWRSLELRGPSREKEVP